MRHALASLLPLRPAGDPPLRHPHRRHPWECPDCSPISAAADDDSVPPPTATATAMATTAPSDASGSSRDLIAAIRAIEADESLNPSEKARRRQELLSGTAARPSDDEKSMKMKEKVGSAGGGDDDGGDVFALLDGTFNCSFCMQLPDRPVTTPCGHNFCLKCFQKWVNQGKHTCAKCRSLIPAKMASQPRINSSLVAAIRMAKLSKINSSGSTPKVYHFMHNQSRPDKAFTTERAKKAGKANACSGKIFVTVAPDHFGPILAENDPARNQGVLVGECWEDRMECRQWGAHLPHVAGIAGQSDYGAQSVALSGGYEDDEDHGEWFLYTGSGGRDLSGNKRTNKAQSFDQKFDKMNEALRVSCKKGFPVRVVRSHKEKRSSYAPETGVRYDGVYRIEKCWRKVGMQGFKVCRYLFVRCDNEPAPWTSDEHGDRPRPLPPIKELKDATDIMERKESPSWEYDENQSRWVWMKPPPASRKAVQTADPEERKRAWKAIRQAQNLSVREKLLKEFSCLICRKVMTLPLTTPCAHNFCKACLEAAFAGKSFVRERTREGGRTLRAQKSIMKCPSCPTDISDFLKNPQVNRELMNVIESLQKKTEDPENAEEDTDELTAETDADGKTDALMAETEVKEKTDLPEDELTNTVESRPKRSYKRKKVAGSSSTELDSGATEESGTVKKVKADYESIEDDSVMADLPEDGKNALVPPTDEKLTWAATKLKPMLKNLIQLGKRECFARPAIHAMERAEKLKAGNNQNS
ncbi:hypothetical protein Syun_024632 [Stephania yunnanensis]|uniref:RING-type E3 ubiquitin transferase n=1 Tax=Stephania yunnanensis TaxID=152371 RepID=A0AAP0I4Q0_9MAGN